MTISQRTITFMAIMAIWLPLSMAYGLSIAAERVAAGDLAFFVNFEKNTDWALLASLSLFALDSRHFTRVLVGGLFLLDLVQLWRLVLWLCRIRLAPPIDPIFRPAHRLLDRGFE